MALNLFYLFKLQKQTTMIDFISLLLTIKISNRKEFHLKLEISMVLWQPIFSISCHSYSPQCIQDVDLAKCKDD